MRKLRSDAANYLVERSDDNPEFDYSCLPASVAKFLKVQAARIRQYGAKTIIQIGKDLAGAKHYLSHGQFLRWVEDEVGIPARTAQAYMRVANWASSKGATVAHLPPTALYALSSPGVPAELVEEVLKRVEAGERIQPPLLRAQIRALREATADESTDTSGEGANRHLEGAQCVVATAAMVSNAVRILARSLTPTDFEQVRDIITSKSVLDDPSLPRILERAFESYESTMSDSYDQSHPLRIMPTAIRSAD